ncbi:hypothetical protein MA16_Dca005430 [Dendrobium catenatum]|uniref:26S proteasome complex subunit SEM1 n=1 Tax=Dendrobium catenatum TaxID=906689 RepID=A0A2I0X3D6_9ASPA|nr:hypothetical protein MA16_Dca005430 [Dendrobium catenatum]
MAASFEIFMLLFILYELQKCILYELQNSRDRQSFEYFQTVLLPRVVLVPRDSSRSKCVLQLLEKGLSRKWDDKEEGKDALQQWEDDWDDDDVNDDFSRQLRKELESNSEKK